jgi:hypothetical protein
MSTIDSYWKYENRPAVLVDYGDDSVGGFYLQEGAIAWEKVTEWDVVQWFKDGGKLSHSDFENLFGKIGVDLPDLPSEKWPRRL